MAASRIMRMTGRGTMVVATLATLFLLVPGAALSAAPEGPRLATVKFGGAPPRLDLLTVDQTGALPRRLAGGGLGKRILPAPLIAPGWSPDGSVVAFSGSVGLEDVKIFVVAADGKGLKAVPGTHGGYSPVFSPDGRSIAFTRIRFGGDELMGRTARPKRSRRSFSGSSAWIVDLAGGGVRQLTPWRNGLENAPTSFSPDGTILALSRDRAGHKDPQAVALRLDGTGATVLAHDASEPVYSPDGSEVAFLRTRYATPGKGRGGKGAAFDFGLTTDLFAVSAAGGPPRRLTRTPGGIELWPSWDPSGQRLSFARFSGRSIFDLLDAGNTLMEVNADGSCPTKILSSRNAVYYGAAWQPGIGREAGPISC